MKKKLSILTATRAEYGLLKPIILALEQDESFDVEVVVTAAHLSPEFGLTYKEIEGDHVRISKKIEVLLSSDTPVSISKSMGLAMISFAEYFAESNPDALLVLGDRYETLAVCCAAMNAGVPIIHMYGGETTEGAIDEAIRHSITKMSILHFTSTEAYRKRVIQLGEHPDTVFCVGAIGVENARKMKLLEKQDLEKYLTLSLDKPYAIVTFHPVTLESSMTESQFAAILQALSEHGEMKYIFTKANADASGRIINKMIDDYVASHENAIAIVSMGTLCYLSALKYATMVIGNSSSGIVEVPSFGIPTINIGNRQKGRIQAKSVLNCEAQKDDISQAIDQAHSESFLKVAIGTDNPYDGGNTAEEIVRIIKNKFKNNNFNLRKKFHDIDF